MSTQHLRNAVWRYATTSEFPRFSRKRVDSHVDAELLHVSARGNERGCRYHIGKRHTSIPAALRAAIATITREPILVGTIRSLDECKNKHRQGPASCVPVSVKLWLIRALLWFEGCALHRAQSLCRRKLKVVT
ncbi:hypothetical protein EAE99_001853 [Botrytis elliptica]|nr:hypothetical protein EAE99_001853 [Botrytis elliptica]